MIRKIVALLALCATTPALADGPCTDQVPPARYTQMAAPDYELVTFTSQAELVRSCGGDRWSRYLACALTDAPVIHMMSDNFFAQIAGDPHKGRRWKDCLIAHEVAHLNGWPGDHPTR